jgi:hypothetical protein
MNAQTKGTEESKLLLTTKAQIQSENGEVFPTVLDKNTGEIKRIKKPFHAFDKSKYPYIVELARKNPLANSLFCFLVDNMGVENAVMVSYKALEEHFDKTRRPLSDAVKYLRINKYIDVLKSGNANVYCINANLVWNKQQNQIHFAKFNAVVIISKSEQIDRNEIKNSFIKYNK